MEEEIRDLIARDAWNELFDAIRRDSLGHDFPRVEASRPDNRALNRYRDVYPYDHSRVKLDNHPPTDYINASLVKAPRANRKYILAQGPLPCTVGHFWLTVWQQESKAVLMLNRVMEKGQVKCHQYWPIDQESDMLFEDVGLRLENLHSVPGDHYTVRTLRLSHVESGESREILHFHYTTWPDFGVPQCPDTFLEFLRAVRDSGSLDPDAGPPVVHCSAGIGRSGTFCLVDTCLVLVTKEGPSSVSIRDVLLELRTYRMGLIQTPDQLKFSYLAIAAGAAEAGLISSSILNGVARGGYDVSSGDSDHSSDGAPPPLPPPRSESLKLPENMRNLLAASHNGNHYSDTYDAIPERLSKAPEQVNGNDDDHSSTSSEVSPDSDYLTRAPGTSHRLSLNKAEEEKEKNESAAKCILNNHKMEERKREMELRRRKKEEARAHTEGKVQEMKRKDKEAVEWRNTKNRIVETVVPFCVGLVMLAVGTYFYTKS